MICEKCGAKAETTICFRCKPGKAILKKITRWGLTFNNMTPEMIQTSSEEKIAMKNFFLDIWKERPHISELSKTHLGKEARSTFFHHILPKDKYLQAVFDPENIILLTLEEHDSVELNMYKYVKINYIREKLLLKYGIT